MFFHHNFGRISKSGYFHPGTDCKFYTTIKHVNNYLKCFSSIMRFESFYIFKENHWRLVIFKDSAYIEKREYLVLHR